MIGTILKTATEEYKIYDLIAGPNRPNANVYLCSNQNDEIFIAKHFYNNKPMANIGLNLYNHYGRRRDGSKLVFEEIQQKCSQFSFLVKHIDRIKLNGRWVIIQEYINGITLSQFIYNNHEKHFDKVLKAVETFSLALNEWHSNQFAHGDPHLDNVIVMENAVTNILSIKLIDYCQIHHPTFHYCKVYRCFDPESDKRIKQDLHETSGKLGKGFKQGLIEIDKELELNTKLVEEFDKFYKSPNCP